MKLSKSNLPYFCFFVWTLRKSGMTKRHVVRTLRPISALFQKRLPTFSLPQLFPLVQICCRQIVKKGAFTRKRWTRSRRKRWGSPQIGWISQWRWRDSGSDESSAFSVRLLVVSHAVQGQTNSAPIEWKIASARGCTDKPVRNAAISWNYTCYGIGSSERWHSCLLGCDKSNNNLYDGARLWNRSRAPSYKYGEV